MARKRIGILTGGGDVPGLNAVIKSVVYGAIKTGDYEVIGIRRGWMGLTHANLEDGFDPEFVLSLDRENTRRIDRTGGTFLHTSRTNPSRIGVDQLPPHVQSRLSSVKEIESGVADLTPIVLENLQRLGIDNLLTIGGDDTLGYSYVLHNAGFPVLAVPKTMDNDVRGTEYCIGFSTALTRAVDAVRRQRTTVGSHERIGIFRIFGRDAGFTALYTAYVTSIRCCIPECPFELDDLIDVLVTDKKNNPSRYSLIVLSEGATWVGRQVEEYGEADAYGHRKKINVAEAFSDEVKRRSGQETIVSDLTYDLRSGSPDFLDKMIAYTFAAMAVECIADGRGGRMMAVRNGRYTDIEIPDPSLGPRRVDVATMYNRERFRPNYHGKQDLPVFLTRA
ncbi:MAG: 6-phosphofructokinase [Bryobacterales bacterium]|nr:6-phosphofructokinase [Bryobacterales bacterium]